MQFTLSAKGTPAEVLNQVAAQTKQARNAAVEQNDASAGAAIATLKDHINTVVKAQPADNIVTVDASIVVKTTSVAPPKEDPKGEKKSSK